MPTTPTTTVNTLTEAQMANAIIIANYGRAHGFSEAEIQVALKIAYIESRLGTNTTGAASTAIGMYQYLVGSWKTSWGDRANNANQIAVFYRDMASWRARYNNHALPIPRETLSFGEYAYVKHHDGNNATNFSETAPALKFWDAVRFNVANPQPISPPVLPVSPVLPPAPPALPPAPPVLPPAPPVLPPAEPVLPPAPPVLPPAPPAPASPVTFIESTPLKDLSGPQDSSNDYGYAPITATFTDSAGTSILILTPTTRGDGMPGPYIVTDGSPDNKHIAWVNQNLDGSLTYKFFDPITQQTTEIHNGNIRLPSAAPDAPLPEEPEPPANTPLYPVSFEVYEIRYLRRRQALLKEWRAQEGISSV